MPPAFIAPLWLDREPLILASRSEGRRRVLKQVGAPFEQHVTKVDERAIEADILARGGDADAVASRLARAKALAFETQAPRWVIGADQVASCEGRLFGKPENLADAAELLKFLSGRWHRLHSALALARGGRIVFETVAHADLRMRALSNDFIESYLLTVGDEALASAGAYQVEGLGAHLFSELRGDHWTIMGLPLLPLLEALRREGVLAS